jgi:hypothetical protein
MHQRQGRDPGPPGRLDRRSVYRGSTLRDGRRSGRGARSPRPVGRHPSLRALRSRPDDDPAQVAAAATLPGGGVRPRRRVPPRRPTRPSATYRAGRRARRSRQPAAARRDRRPRLARPTGGGSFTGGWVRGHPGAPHDARCALACWFAARRVRTRPRRRGGSRLLGFDGGDGPHGRLAAPLRGHLVAARRRARAATWPSAKAVVWPWAAWSRSRIGAGRVRRAHDATVAGPRTLASAIRGPARGRARAVLVDRV